MGKFDAAAVSGVSILSPQVIKLTSAVKVDIDAPDLMEAMAMKMGMYTMAMTLYGTKVDIGALKVDEHMFKLSQGQIKAGTDAFNLLRGFFSIG